MRRIAVVGASLAGLRSVEALRREGYDGELWLVGEELHAPYDRPPLSKQVLRGEWAPERIRLRAPDDLAKLDLQLKLGVRATALDGQRRELTLSDGTTLAFDGLVIATGATPRRLTFGHELAGVHVLRTLDDALALRGALQLRPRVCVIGAGFIGLEVAASCRTLGLEVHVVEPLALPLLPRLGERMARVVDGLHRDHGVDLRCDQSVTGFEGQGRLERVRLADGSAFEADLAVVGVGVTPNVGWLQGSGLKLLDGVCCDATCATALPDVVAVGDCARWPNARFAVESRVEHWSNAVEMAAHAARRLLAGASFNEPFLPVPYFWSDQYDLKIQFAGHTRAGDELAFVEGSEADRRGVALYGRGGKLTAVLALGRPAQLVRYRAQIAQGVQFPGGSLPPP
jgi:3-phenylpropionate/trans-cinnamate dioxygenase ferredoxin reductase subunit